MEIDQYRKLLYLQFKNDHPETIGETDKEFDRVNYNIWLEEKIFELTKDKKPEEDRFDPYGAFFDKVVGDGQDPDQAARDLGLL